MKKNDFLKIARSVYMQDKIAKQLYAALFNPNQSFNNELGDFSGGHFTTFYGLFSIFTGSEKARNTTGVNQFITKEQDTYKIYPLDKNGNMIQGSAPFRTFDSLRKLNAFLQSNNARTSTGTGSLIQTLIDLKTSISFEGKTEQQCLKIINKQNDSSSDDVTRLNDVLFEALEWWRNYLQQLMEIIRGYQNLEILPLVFDQVQKDSLAASIKSLNMLINKQLDSKAKQQCHPYLKLDRFNVSESAEKMLRNISNWILQVSQIKKLWDIAPKQDRQTGGSQFNLKSVCNQYSNIAQHVSHLYDAIYALNKYPQPYITYVNAKSEEIQIDKNQLLQDLKNSKTNKQLNSKNPLGANFNLKNLVKESFKERQEDTESGGRKSVINTVVNFVYRLNNSKQLRTDTWEKTKKQLHYIYDQDANAKNIIDIFDTVFYGIYSNQFKRVNDAYRILSANKTISVMNGTVSALQRNSRRYTNGTTERAQIDDFCKKIDQFIVAIRRSELFDAYNKPTSVQVDKMVQYCPSVFAQNNASRSSNIKLYIQFADSMNSNLDAVSQTSPILTKDLLVHIFNNLRGTGYGMKSNTIPRKAFNDVKALTDLITIIYPKDEDKN